MYLRMKLLSSLRLYLQSSGTEISTQEDNYNYFQSQDELYESVISCNII